MDNDTRLEKQEDIIQHIEHYFKSIYSKEEWCRPNLDDLPINSIEEDKASWLEREFCSRSRWVPASQLSAVLEGCEG